MQKVDRLSEEVIFLTFKKTNFTHVLLRVTRNRAILPTHYSSTSRENNDKKQKGNALELDKTNKFKFGILSGLKVAFCCPEWIQVQKRAEKGNANASFGVIRSKLVNSRTFKRSCKIIVINVD